MGSAKRRKSVGADATASVLYSDCPTSPKCPRIDEALHHLWHEGKYDECIQRYTEILGTCSRCPRANTQLAAALSSAGQYDKADDLLERLLPRAADDENLSSLYSHKGTMLIRVGLIDEAVPWLLAAADLDDYPGHKANLASVLWRVRKRTVAAKLAREALRQSPVDPAIIDKAARVLLEAGEIDELRKNLLALLKRTKAHPYYYISVAAWCQRAGLEKEALTVARRIARSNPESVTIACTASWILFDSDGREAKTLLNRLLKLDPVGHGKYALMNLAMIAGRSGNVETLLGLAVKADTQFHDVDTERLVGKAMKSVRQALRGGRAELNRVTNEYLSMKLQHDSLSESLAGYDLTEGGTNLEWALRDGEGWHIEFKSQMPDNVRDLAVEMAALSSQGGGGTIFLGIADDGTVLGVPTVSTVKERDSWRHRVSQIATKTVQPSNPVTVYFNQKDGKDIIKVWVPEGSAPIYYVDNIPYLRNADESRKANPDEVLEHIARRSGGKG